ncbi:uncharacterized protein LY89DRAFT_353178 [Mollisia scopiformis]|uniref:Uncharacterized protein n=1 Tax=Mollisia scopiformis TaxID=149040 RepID=A0A132B765_MOLSC|nr:uncharacterized protein LY89DRAFT_353178 [Mollisia scopiformis]KUJ07839.1 hypothetical protein LY89DRAFT_353178 [Mollisia scopiformis]
MSAPSSPKIHRPNPRRPYEQTSPSFLPAHQSSASLLSPSSYTDESPSRTQSILNLTSSTLLGIYSPTGYQPDQEYDFPSTPWGTGAETPQRTSSISDPVPIRRHTAPSQPSSAFGTAAALALRGVLLFGIGMGYGLLVRHLHNDRQLAPFQVEGIIKPRNDWRYLVFWGVAGVCLGSLMPWVDTLFSYPAGMEEKQNASSSVAEKDEVEEESGLFGADWTPVVRSVGAFVGIAYAIRKLPWATPLQASLTLFLVNPVLWYLIDRSAPGFILSASVGAIGTSLLLASNPDMMPSPASSTSTFRNTTFKPTTPYTSGTGIVNRESFEVGIWILSVLFCSCVCFGNVGRRLALSSGAKRR